MNKETKRFIIGLTGFFIGGIGFVTTVANILNGDFYFENWLDWVLIGASLACMLIGSIEIYKSTE